MKYCILCLLLYIPFSFYSQTEQDTTKINPRYFEDQFYVGITYNFILKLPEGVNQRNFSYGIQGGFIKDIPFNKDRTFGVGLGLGLGLYTYYTNIRASENGGEISYVRADVNDFRRSKLETHVVEFPFELRWRNSDSETYSFWRIYAGLKLGYAINARSKFVLDDTKDTFDNTDARGFQYGLTLNFGYHNFNVHAYYSLTNLLDDGVTLDGNEFTLTPLRIGLIFYIL